jgi:hypothetical protein
VEKMEEVDVVCALTAQVTYVTGSTTLCLDASSAMPPQLAAAQAQAAANISETSAGAAAAAAAAAAAGGETAAGDAARYGPAVADEVVLVKVALTAVSPHGLRLLRATLLLAPTAAAHHSIDCGGGADGGASAAAAEGGGSEDVGGGDGGGAVADLPPEGVLLETGDCYNLYTLLPTNLSAC